MIILSLYMKFREVQSKWYIYIHTKLYLNHASLNNRWKAGFHEGREMTYLQEINYLQKYNKKNTGDFNCTTIHIYKQVSTHSLF
jgi:hypothetical protein